MNRRVSQIPFQRAALNGLLMLRDVSFAHASGGRSDRPQESGAPRLEELDPRRLSEMGVWYTLELGPDAGLAAK